MIKINFYAKWILRAAIIFSLFFTLMTKHWVGTAGGTIVLIATFSVDYINYKFFKINTTITSMVYIYCIFSLVMGNMWDFYDKLEWWDIVMHIISGIILGMIGDMILNSHVSDVMPITKIRFLFIIGIACIGGLVWEIYEFSIDCFFNLDTQLSKVSGVSDTMWDLIADLLGGVGIGIYLSCAKNTLQIKK